MIKLKQNADELIRNLISRKSVWAYYKSVCDNFTNGYENTFITDFQILITKIGISVSEVSNGPRISNCYQSIKFLCVDVLENPEQMKTFYSLGINTKGNSGKHTIDENHIEMVRCVTFYNTFLISVSEKCGLPALKKLIIRKNKATPKHNYSVAEAIPRCDSSRSSLGTIKRGQHSSIQFSNSDENLTLTLEIATGNGKYEKGLIKKISMFNFKLKVKILNPSHFKISKLTAVITSNKKSCMTMTPTTKFTEVDLPTEKFGNKITITVTAVYKIGLLKQKKIQTSATRVFDF